MKSWLQKLSFSFPKLIFYIKNFLYSLTNFNFITWCSEIENVYAVYNQFSKISCIICSENAFKCMQWFFLSIKFSSFKIFRYGIAHIGRVGSVFMTLSVTLERFFAILYPLKRMYLKTTLLIFSVVFSVVYNIPRFLEFETVVGNRTNEEDNSTISNETVST